ncbi:alpha/beta hydrolase family protein [Streptomyces milbemycinicus]|uniref:Integral membrane protein n=1 Tax=Streptomyces milbemycinicus TaxID=476552 RepID=A0ABW8LIH3_9ACTN
MRTSAETAAETGAETDGGPPPDLELLVHGVGGTTPQEMLTDPRTVLVTGDETAGIYRRIEDADAEDRPQDYRESPVREAYCWSNLTSGNGARALWLLLLPFMVANLAHWMRPAADRRERTVRGYGLLVRLIALSLTVLLLAGACEVALDLVAWQCAGSHSCGGNRSWLGFMSPRDHGWWSQPGRRLALASLVPTALGGLLWYLSNRTWSAYESQPPLRRPVDESDPASGNRAALCLPGFWYGRRIVARLRAAHTAACFLTVAAGLTMATAAHDREPGGSALLDAIGWLLLALLGTGGVLVVYVVCRRGRSETKLDDELDRVTTTALPGAALGLLALAMLYAGWSRPGWTSQGRLPGDSTFGVLALIQGTLVVALAGCALALHRAAPAGRTPLRGLAGPAVAMLACGLGAVLCGGVAQRVADWLDGDATPGMDSGAPMDGPPVLLSWQAAVIPTVLLVVVLVALFFAVRVWRVRRRLVRTVPDGYPGERPDSVRTRKIAGVIARAGLTDSAPGIVGPVALATLLLGAAAVVGAWASHRVPGRAADGAPPVIEAAAQTAQALGSWLMGLAFLLLVTWARRAYRSPSARRTIGILWDVGTFWPRAAHPFAPPCYAERAVPDLTWRMETWTRRHGGRLVISGHSQGSVLAAAAVWQVDRRTRGRVALLTYGSPLERLYGRWFPAYFGTAELCSLHDEVRCWRNLWRYTDPIGGPIRLPDGTGPEVDHDGLKDPLAYGRTPDHPLPAPILGHADYQADPTFDRERAGLLARLPEQHPAAHKSSGPPSHKSSGRSSG